MACPCSLGKFPNGQFAAGRFNFFEASLINFTNPQFVLGCYQFYN